MSAPHFQELAVSPPSSSSPPRPKMMSLLSSRYWDLWLVVGVKHVQFVAAPLKGASEMSGYNGSKLTDTFNHHHHHPNHHHCHRQGERSWPKPHMAVIKKIIPTNCISNKLYRLSMCDRCEKLLVEAARLIHISKLCISSNCDSSAEFNCMWVPLCWLKPFHQIYCTLEDFNFRTGNSDDHGKLN